MPTTATTLPADAAHGENTSDATDADGQRLATIDYYCRVHGTVTLDRGVRFGKEHNAATGCLPTLTAVEDAATLLAKLRARHDWVFVFWDSGWGDSPDYQLEVSICTDGDGDNPHALITTDVYDALLSRGTIDGNTYGGFKARRIHDFQPKKR